MDTDPNADLIGFHFLAGGVWPTVTGSAAWNPTYVEVSGPTGTATVRPAAQVRHLKESR